MLYITDSYFYFSSLFAAFSSRCLTIDNDIWYFFILLFSLRQVALLTKLRWLLLFFCAKKIKLFLRRVCTFPSLWTDCKFDVKWNVWIFKISQLSVWLLQSVSKQIFSLDFFVYFFSNIFKFLFYCFISILKFWIFKISQLSVRLARLLVLSQYFFQNYFCTKTARNIWPIYEGLFPAKPFWAARIWTEVFPLCFCQ